MLVPDLSNPFFTLLIDEIERHIEVLGMSVLVCTSQSDLARESQRLRSLASIRVDALIVIPMDAVRSGAALRATAKEVPVIQVDQFADGVEADWVGTDERYGMELLVDHLRAQGVRTAAFIGGAPVDSSSRARCERVTTLAHEHGVSLNAEAGLLGPYSSEWGAEATRRICTGGALPEAIICGADIIAFGVLRALDAGGFEVPRDIIVTGFDGIEMSEHPRLSITTVRQPVEAIALQVAALVADIIDNTLKHQRGTYSFRPELVVRASSIRSGAST